MATAGESIVQMAQDACVRHGDVSAFLYLVARLSYRELDRQNSDFAHWLVQVQGLLRRELRTAPASQGAASA